MAIPTRVVLALSLSGIAACGDSGPGIPLSTLAGKIVESQCEIGVRCGTYPDRDTCIAANRSDFGQILVDVSSGKTHYDPVAAQSCLAQLGESHGLGSCAVSERLAIPFPLVCRSAFVGTLAEGASCTANEQCLSESCNKLPCVGTGACCTGHCDPVVPSPVPPGGACGQLGSYCSDDSVCEGLASGSVCVTKAALDEPCAVLGACEAGLACIPGLAAPVCGVLPAEGQPCSGDTPGCDLTVDFCDPATLTCAHRIAVGDPCPSGIGCVDYAYCDAGQLVCVARGHAGDRCLAQIFACLGDLVCENGKCAFPTPAVACK